MNEHGPGPVPNRWLHCPRKSNSFIADKFLAFKTPLSERFDSQVPIECQFPPDMLFSSMKTYKLKLGLWIDLTNTSRFYNRKDIETFGCKYIKLQCRGHGETPSNEQTRSFIEIVDNFIADHPLDIIGVHCTHGFNRTGFLIVSYMVEKMDCSVEAALMAFSQARPPGIYKEDYIRELFARYDDADDAPPAPALPDWCFEYDDSNGSPSHQKNYYNDNNTSSRKRQHDEVDNASNFKDDDDENNILPLDSNSSKGGESSSKSRSEPPAKKGRRKEFLNLNATFMAGVPGVTLITDQPRLGNIQSLVQKMCKWKDSGFPGCQPVSMDMTNLEFLHTKPYRVSWKADGTRYMMLILKENEIYFLDRDNSCFEVTGMRFLNRKDLKIHLKNTLVDGEMVIDKVNGLSIPRYLVYDIIKFEGEDMAQEAFFPHRLTCIEKEIIKPRHAAMQRGIIDKSTEPFSVRNKMFWDLTQAGALLGSKFAKTLAHEPDGLIFQPSVEPYVPGRCFEVLKWKPLHMNSVDFRFKISEEKGIGIVNRKIGLLYVGQLDVPFAQIKMTRALRELNNKIIECKYENNHWVFMRERTDKSFPNSYDTAMGVCESIKNPVTKEILLNFIATKRFISDSEVMPPPTNRRN